MSSVSLTDEEKIQLLRLARRSIELAVKGKPLPALNLEDYSPRLRAQGASFVTLTKNGELRGCIGTLEPHQPLVQDVCEHAVAAALEDFRFPPLEAHELAEVKIEISCLTVPKEFCYESPAELVKGLRPGIDGVVIRDGLRRATFLPQVWEKLPQPEEFLDHLCLKMGAPASLWRRKPLTVLTYQVEEFSEDQFQI